MTAPPRLFSTVDVARLLGVKSAELTWWGVASAPGKRYRSFEIQRKDGTARTIDAPVKPLKDIQRRLTDQLTLWYEPPLHVHGFVPQRSPITNAHSHRGREWVLRVDLADFFPSINFGRVRGLFLSYPFDFTKPVATLLAQICCHDGRLPQGAPTSPMVSNFICHSLDRDLANLAWNERCSFSRYADDLCFSTERGYFPPQLAHIDSGRTVAGPAIETAVHHNGFAINPGKSKLMRRTQRQRVTGLVVNEKANVPRDYVRDLRNLLYIWKRYGEADAIESWRRQGGPRNWPPGKSLPEFAQVARGRVQYVGSIKGWTSSVYLGLAKALAEVDGEFVLRHAEPDPMPAGEAIEVRLFTEGKTDPFHMLAAQRHFHRNGEFTDFKLLTEEETSRDGDDGLLKHCEALSITPQPKPCLCLFDRDNDVALKSALDLKDWKDWKNGVVAVALVGSGTERICIETLYDQSAREIEDSAGRRLFLMSEFDRRSGLHESRLFTTPHPKSTKLVPESVYAVEDGRSIGLTKDDFAAAIYNETDDFSAVSFEGFRLTFEAIREAVAVATKGTATD
jgi:RNA-directed DNA polymerase